MKNQKTKAINGKRQRRLPPATCSASWTEHVWNGKSYDETRNIVVRAETVQEASLLLEKEMASPMMPNGQALPQPVAGRGEK